MTTSGIASASTRGLAGLDGLSPACFGRVMAAGIVSLAAHLLALPASRARRWRSTSWPTRCCGC
jgi:hypothetical protein